MGSQARRGWVAVSIIFFTGCDCLPFFSSPETVDVQTVFYAAWRYPETFDDQIPDLSYHKRSAECLKKKSRQAFAAEDDQIDRCAQMVSYTTEWNECHDEADQMHNSGVVLLNIADALEGNGLFRESPGGQYLILLKIAVGDQAYQQTIDFVEELVPRGLKCELECR